VGGWLGGWVPEDWRYRAVCLFNWRCWGCGGCEGSVAVLDWGARVRDADAQGSRPELYPRRHSTIIWIRLENGKKLGIECTTYVICGCRAIGEA
jgi:hypothetical protein